MKIRVLPEAHREFLEAISYYEAAQPGLGDRFKERVDEAVSRAISHTAAHHLRPEGYRRLNLHTFPYYIAFIEQGDVLHILAIAHQRRIPLYWITRRKRIGSPDT